MIDWPKLLDKAADAIFRGVPAHPQSLVGWLADLKGGWLSYHIDNGKTLHLEIAASLPAQVGHAPQQSQRFIIRP
jgi:hypothetical protein